MAESGESFLVLMDLHRALDGKLAEHQVGLVLGKMDDAVLSWREFSSGLARHATDEEQHLLTLYASRGPLPPGGTVELFLAEHNKIRSFLQEISALMDVLAAADALDGRKIIQLIEREYELKRLLEHHDMREKNFLYPLLDQRTTPEERRLLLARLRH